MLQKLLASYVLNVPEYWSKEIGNCLHQDWFCSKTITQVADITLQSMEPTMQHDDCTGCFNIRQEIISRFLGQM